MAPLSPGQRQGRLMSEQDKQARLDQAIDRAVNDFLSLPDSKVLERVKELTGKEDAIALDFDRLIVPILRQHRIEAARDWQTDSAEVSTSNWRNSMEFLIHSLFSRPMRSAFATLIVVAGATLSVPLWRVTPDQDSNNIRAEQGDMPRSVPKGAIGRGPVKPSTGGDAVYIAQLVNGTNFSKAAEALDLINSRYLSLLREQSLVIRRASGEDGGAYIGGVGGLKSAQDAEQLCSRIRAGGDPCHVVIVPKE